LRGRLTICCGSGCGCVRCGSAAFAALALTAATIFAVTAAVLVTTDPRPAVAPLVLAVTVARTRQLIRAGKQSR
jgi:hypothetical protein